VGVWGGLLRGSFGERIREEGRVYIVEAGLECIDTKRKH